MPNDVPSLPGVRDDGNGRVTLCGWCDGARDITDALAHDGYAVNHSMCAECAARMNAELDKKR